MSSQLPFDQVTLLKDRNDKLSAQAAVHRQEIARLQRRIDELVERETPWKETLLCVNRLWEELNETIAFLRYRVTGNIEQNDSKKGNADLDMLDDVNPFLAKLLGMYVEGDDIGVDVIDSFTHDVGETEKRLRARMRETLLAANSVLEKVESSSPENVSTDVGMAKTNAHLAAMNSLLRAEVEKLKDQALKDLVTIKDLETNLADKEDELLVAQRKIVYLKEASTKDAPALGNALSSQLNSPEAQSLNVASMQDRKSAIVDTEEVENLKKQLKDRSSEVEQRDIALNKMERELREIRIKLSAERSTAERTQKYHKDQIESLQHSLDDAELKIRNLYRECDGLTAGIREAEFALDRANAAGHRLADANRHLRDLEDRMAAAWNGRRKAESELENLKAHHASFETVTELKKTIENLEQDLKSSRESLKKYRSEAAEVSSARSLAAQSSREASEATALTKVLNDRIDAMRQKLEGYELEKEAWALRQEELRLFTEVSMYFQSNALHGEKQENQEETIQNTIQSFLNDLIDDIKSRLEKEISSSLRNEREPSRETLVLQADRLEEEKSVLLARVEGLEKEIKVLHDEASALREDGESFAEEVEGLTEAYQQAQERNAHWSKLLAQRDEDNGRLMAEAAIAARERAVLTEEKEAAVAAKLYAEQESSKLDNKCKDLERRIQTLLDDLNAAKLEARSHLSKVEDLSREIMSSQHTAIEAGKRAKLEEERSNKILDEYNATKLALRQERTSLEQLNKQLKDLQNRLSGGVAGMDEETKDEIKALRKMVNCTVCSARIKNRIITRCNHIFCAECIDGVLSARNRKCPGCGEKFGANDVKPFFFT